MCFKRMPVFSFLVVLLLGVSALNHFGCVRPSQGSSDTTVQTPGGAVQLTVNGGTFSVSPTVVTVAPPTGFRFPFGAVAFKAQLNRGTSALQVTLNFPDPLPQGAKLFKCFPGASSCEEITEAVLAGRSASYTIEDGGAWDADQARNGGIEDPVAVGVPTGGGGEGEGEGEPEGSHEGSSEGSIEGEGEGEGEPEGSHEGSSEGSIEGEGEGTPEGHVEGEAAYPNVDFVPTAENAEYFFVAGEQEPHRNIGRIYVTPNQYGGLVHLRIISFDTMLHTCYSGLLSEFPLVNPAGLQAYPYQVPVTPGSTPVEIPVEMRWDQEQATWIGGHFCLSVFSDDGTQLASFPVGSVETFEIESFLADNKPLNRNYVGTRDTREFHFGGFVNGYAGIDAYISRWTSSDFPFELQFDFSGLPSGMALRAIDRVAFPSSKHYRLVVAVDEGVEEGTYPATLRITSDPPQYFSAVDLSVYLHVSPYVFYSRDPSSVGVTNGFYVLMSRTHDIYNVMGTTGMGRYFRGSKVWKDEYRAQEGGVGAEHARLVFEDLKTGERREFETVSHRIDGLPVIYTSDGTLIFPIDYNLPCDSAEYGGELYHPDGTHQRVAIPCNSLGWRDPLSATKDVSYEGLRSGGFYLSTVNGVDNEGFWVRNLFIQWDGTQIVLNQGWWPDVKPIDVLPGGYWMPYGTPGADYTSTGTCAWYPTTLSDSCPYVYPNEAPTVLTMQPATEYSDAVAVVLTGTNDTMLWYPSSGRTEGIPVAVEPSYDSIVLVYPWVVYWVSDTSGSYPRLYFVAVNLLTGERFTTRAKWEGPAYPLLPRWREAVGP
jgi:hypothetical protein